MSDKKYSFFFLDRDGVINTNGFVNTPQDFEFLPKSLDALRLLNERDKKVFVATNQGGIEAGFLTWETLREIHVRMKLAVMEEGGRIDEIYYCPHLKKECECRKPRPGMLLKAIEDHDLQGVKDECCFIGDWHTDWEAAIAAGIQPIAVASGREWENAQTDFLFKYKIPIYDHLLDAVTSLI